MTPFSGPSHRCCGSATTAIVNVNADYMAIKINHTEVPESSHVGKNGIYIHPNNTLRDLGDGEAHLQHTVCQFSGAVGLSRWGIPRI